MLTGLRRQNPMQDTISIITYSMMSKILSVLPILTTFKLLVLNLSLIMTECIFDLSSSDGKSVGQ